MFGPDVLALAIEVRRVSTSYSNTEHDVRVTDQTLVCLTNKTLIPDGVTWL